MSNSKNTRIRELQPADGPAVASLIERVGFDSETQENRGSEVSKSVDKLRPDNPSLVFGGGRLAPGWVIEAHGDIVGHLGNLPLRYIYKGRDILAAAASGMIVQPGYRSLSAGLVAKFANQENAELLLNTTAAPVPNKIFKAFQFNEVPSPEYDRVFYWVCDAYGFSGVAVRRLGLRGTVASLARPPIACVFAARNAQLSWRAVKQGKNLSIDRTNTIDSSRSDLNIFWETVRKDSSRLLADRCADSLAWHFGGDGNTGRVRFIRCNRRGKLVGYVILASFPAPTIGLRRLRIVDLVALDDSTEIIDVLLSAAHDTARKAKSHILELIGFPAEIRTRAIARRPWTRSLPSWTYLYKTTNQHLNDCLATSDSWYACPYDGDASIM